MSPNISLRDLVPGARDARGLAALFAAYAAAVWVGLQWAIAPGSGSPIWPGAGVAFAGLVLGGPQLWPAILAGRIAVAIAIGVPQPMWAQAAVGAASAAAALAPALIIRRTGGLEPRLGSLHDIGRLILTGGVLGAPISGLGVVAIWAAGAPTRTLPELLANWIPGFFVGLLLTAPLTFALVRWRDWRVSPVRALHLGACLAATALVSAHIFLRPLAWPVGTWQVWPVLVWAALAFSVQGASAALGVVALMGVWGALHGLWPAAGAQTIADRMLMLQEFLGASAITVLVLGAAADERRAKQQLEVSERRLAEGLAAQEAIAAENARLYAAAQTEIEERKRAEEHQRLLINELNHRVKNTLATVQSIAAQTRRTALDPKASYEAFVERLMALSRAHDVLTRERWEGAALRAVVDGAIRPFEDAAGARFRISGPSVWLEPHTALALAMALHELATNAAKYGALSVAGGVVTLSWTAAADGAEGLRLELTWREAGGAAGDAAQPAGLRLAAAGARARGRAERQGQRRIPGRRAGLRHAGPRAPGRRRAGAGGRRIVLISFCTVRG